MFVILEDKTICLTRGDVACFNVSATLPDGSAYVFGIGDVVQLKVFRRKDCGSVVLCKRITVNAETEVAALQLTKDDTKIGEIISRPVDYWYEVELNPDTEPQTIIGYDENGEKVFRLYPEGM